MKLAAHRAGRLAAALGGGLLLAIFILLNLPALRRIFASIKSVLRSVTRGDICFIATILAAVNLLVFIYAKNSSTIYYWDNAGYWSVSRELAELWKNEGTKRLLEVVFDSVLTLDYNYLIILPAIVCVRLLGSSRYIFLSSIANFGYLPVCVLVWYMAKRYTKHQLIITTITLLFFFQRLVSTKLLADYSSLYVAYKIGLDKDILLLFRYFGIIPLILFFAAGICLLFSKSQRCDAAFLMIWSVLCFCLFVRVQTHGQQHLLMYAPAFMCMIRYLDSLGAKGLHVGLLASSFILNQDMLLNSEASLSLPRVSDISRNYLVYLPDVDQRDGWSDALFKCDILAVADPPQTHLGEENQAVVVRMISTQWMIWSENISQAQI